MKSKILRYIAIFTVFLVSTVCFLYEKKLSAYQPVCITFVYQNQTFVYDQSKIKFDKYQNEVISGLEKRCFFESCQKKHQKIAEILNMGFDIKVATKFVLVGVDDVVDLAKSKIEKEKKDSCITFCPNSKTLFQISEGVDGVEVDEMQLYQKVADCLKTKNVFEVEIPAKTVKAVTKKENINKTQLKAKFSTSYANSLQDRKSNVSLALSKFDGLVVQSGEQISFNKIVGKRTEENGYKNAKIISYGKYADGIGGGVCQASTTLYNALLLADLQIDEWHRHTLKSNYVMPSFDAMVNDNGADLVFTNNTNSPVYITTKCDENNVSVCIYGLKNQYQISCQSVTKENVRANIREIADLEKKYSDKVLFEDETFWLQNPVDGIVSEGYLVYKKGGKECFKKLIRKDRYNFVDGVVVRGVEKRVFANKIEYETI